MIQALKAALIIYILVWNMRAQKVIGLLHQLMMSVKVLPLEVGF